MVAPARAPAEERRILRQRLVTHPPCRIDGSCNLLFARPSPRRVAAAAAAAATAVGRRPPTGRRRPLAKVAELVQRRSDLAPRATHPFLHLRAFVDGDAGRDNDRRRNKQP
jgi:hypothetical protein